MELSLSTSSFSSLPDEIAESCLARIPRSYYPRLSTFSRSFRSLLSSKELYAARSLLGTTEQCLYLCVRDNKCNFFEWFTLWNNPNPTSPDLKKKKLVPIPPSNFPSLSIPTVVGSEIYVIGGPVHGEPSSIVRVLDCRTHTWRNAPSMNVARAKAFTCAYGGKIYVIGGGKVDELPFAEVFDIETQTWECLPDSCVDVPSPGFYRIKEFNEKSYFGNASSSYKFYAYDPEQCKWECNDKKTVMLPMSWCVIENVFYSFRVCKGNCTWYDIKDREWKRVKGLDSLDEIIMMKGENLCASRIVRFGGKFLAIWEEYIRDSTPSDRMKNIWCAEIVVEKRDGGEIWGDVEWVDVVHTVPTSCELLRCVAVLL